VGTGVVFDSRGLVTTLGIGAGFGRGGMVCFGGIIGNGAATLGNEVCTLGVAKEEIWIFRVLGIGCGLSPVSQKRKSPKTST